MPEGYVWPSQCEQCVAVPTYEASGAYGMETVTYAHQDTCPNRPNITRSAA